MEVVARLIEALRRITEPEQQLGQACDDPKPIAIRKAYKAIEEIKK